MSFERCFDLDGLGVRLSGAGRDLEIVVERLLGAYAVPALAAAPAVSISVERRAATPSAPPEPPRFTFPPMSAWAAASGAGWHLVDDVAELDVGFPADPARPAEISGWLAADASLPQVSRFAGLTLWVALMEALRPRGRYPLHAAALVGPDGATLLFAGTKGAGKSTATLALLEAGWDVVTDDTVFLERDAAAGGRPALIGYAKRFHVRPDLLERRPDLAAFAHAPEPWEPQDKRWLALDARFPGRTRTRAAAPAVILFPSIVDAARSSITPLAPRAALIALLAESSFVFLRQELAPEHLAVLGELVDGAACARLHAGRDLLADPTLYARLVDEARGTSSWTRAASA